MGKLFVIFARDIPDAIIIRRGPSAWHHLVSWNTETDDMTHGAWIKGRIFEDKCDLSPDGKLFLYFVLKENLNELGLPNTWTALSRPPWLKALALWPHGDTYFGGGRFLNNREIILRPNCPSSEYDCHPDFPNKIVDVCEVDDPGMHQSEHLVPGANWSGRDNSGRTIYAVGDQLKRIEAAGVETLVADFSELSPAPGPAPEWAGEWDSDQDNDDGCLRVVTLDVAGEKTQADDGRRMKRPGFSLKLLLGLVALLAIMLAAFIESKVLVDETSTLSSNQQLEFSIRASAFGIA